MAPQKLDYEALRDIKFIKYKDLRRLEGVNHRAMKNNVVNGTKRQRASEETEEGEIKEDNTSIQSSSSKRKADSQPEATQAPAKRRRLHERPECQESTGAVSMKPSVKATPGTGEGAISRPRKRRRADPASPDFGDSPEEEGEEYLGPPEWYTRTPELTPESEPEERPAKRQRRSPVPSRSQPKARKGNEKAFPSAVKTKARKQKRDGDRKSRALKVRFLTPDTAELEEAKRRCRAAHAAELAAFGASVES